MAVFFIFKQITIMRYLLLLLLICCYNLCCQGQSLAWERLLKYPYAPSTFNQFTDVQPLRDGSFVVVGFHNDIVGNNPVMNLIGYNAQGDTIWTEPGSAPAVSLGTSVKQLPDSNLVHVSAAPHANNQYLSDILLRKVNLQGQVLWQKQYDAFHQMDYSNDVQVLPDGDLLITATVDSFIPQLVNPMSMFYLLRTDSLGNKRWGRYYGGFTMNRPSKTLVTSRGTFVMAGSFLSYPQYGTYRPLLIEVDQNGDSLQGKVLVLKDTLYQEYIFNVWHNLIETADSNYVFSSWIDSLSQVTQTHRQIGAMVKVDRQFNLLWKTYLRSPLQRQLAVKQVRELKDGTLLVLANETYPYRNSFLLFHISQQGQLLSRRRVMISQCTQLELMDWDFLSDSSIVAVGRCGPYDNAWAARIDSIDQYLLSSPELHATAPGPMLGQNYPNPFTGETTVDYSLTASAPNAELVVFDLVTGRVLLQKQVEGSGSATLNCAHLARGIYGYGLRLNGQLLQVRKMSLQQ